MAEAAKAKGTAKATAKRTAKGAAETERAAPPEPHGADGHVCTVTFCPICLAVTAGQAVRPEAVEHLLAAGREFMLALSSILGARAEEPGSERPTATLTRIDIE
jgi:hypothetical protein